MEIYVPIRILMKNESNIHEKKQVILLFCTPKKMDSQNTSRNTTVNGSFVDIQFCPIDLFGDLK